MSLPEAPIERALYLVLGIVVLIPLWGVCGCGTGIPIPPDGSMPPVFNNTTDPTNAGAKYIGADACRACHPAIAVQHNLHGHANPLTKIEGQPPAFPPLADPAAVPNPPDGYAWTDISYVIGGYRRKALFVDLDGYVVTEGADGTGAQWNLDFPANSTTAGFATFQPATSPPTPYDESCLKCHATGTQSPDAAFPEFQDNRPGMAGTWHETGVQCEACHGPGSNHIPSPDKRDIFVDGSAERCGSCHSRDGDPSVIRAQEGYILPYQQWSELLSSGSHAQFNCTTCHRPHVSVNYDRSNALRNNCTSCHSDQNMALHEGVIFVRGNYQESLSCESCHMPFATRNASSAGADVVGPLGRMGDTRTHIFRINTATVDYTAMFDGTGSSVIEDDQGRSAVTVDFVCLRCHNGIGNAPAIPSLELIANVASGIHDIVVP